MSSKIKRLQNIPGAESASNVKRIKVDGLPQLSADMQQIVNATRESTEEIAKQVKDLVSALASNDSTSDSKEVAKAIASLEMAVTKKTNVTDYVVEFERDANGLIKSGMTFTAKVRQ